MTDEAGPSRLPSADEAGPSTRPTVMPTEDASEVQCIGQTQMQFTLTITHSYHCTEIAHRLQEEEYQRENEAGPSTMLPCPARIVKRSREDDTGQWFQPQLHIPVK